MDLAKNPEKNAARLRDILNAEAKTEGYTVKAYHGTGRADWVGTVFLPERATSGSMAFFTSDRGIAENYSKDKQDTSIAYDNEYADYYAQFRVNYNGKSISVSELWDKLSAKEKQIIKENARHITFDDEGENIVYDDNAQYGLGNFDDYTIHQNKGNYLSALTQSWLEDGNLYGDERSFIEVLKLAGLDKKVEYRDPTVRNEKVYDVYLKITNPFNTSTEYNEGFLKDLKSW